MDTSDPAIVFDEHGVCNHCSRAELLLKTRLPGYKSGQYPLDRLVRRIRAEGQGKPYDCIVGVSGGADSTYAAYAAKKCGLRLLAVHFDNGWNAALAVHNIESVLRKLDIDLFTHVVDWEEFRDLQLSFLRASVPDAEIPTDHGIWALLFQTAARFKIRYVISGTNISTESILPRSWTYYVTDWTYIKDIYQRFGTTALRTFPHCNVWRFMYYVLVRRVRMVSILNMIDYKREAAIAELERELGWRSYGGKHHESMYTRFFQSYILPIKFGIDKRRAHLSSLIMSGQVAREEALEELQKPIADPATLYEDRIYVTKKLNLTPAEFEAIMSLPVKSYHAYRNESRRYRRLLSLMRRGQRLRLLPSQIGM